MQAHKKAGGFSMVNPILKIGTEGSKEKIKICKKC